MERKHHVCAYGSCLSQVDDYTVCFHCTQCILSSGTTTIRQVSTQYIACTGLQKLHVRAELDKNRCVVIDGGNYNSSLKTMITYIKATIHVDNNWYQFIILVVVMPRFTPSFLSFAVSIT